VPDQLNPAWVRLGEMLVRRRIALDPRYRNRRTFTAERAPRLYRIINDMELGKRGKFEPATKAAIEAAYDLAPGAIDRAAAGGELVPPARPLVPAAVPDAPEVIDLMEKMVYARADPLEVKVWETESISKDDRAKVIIALWEKDGAHAAELAGETRSHGSGTGLAEVT